MLKCAYVFLIVCLHKLTSVFHPYIFINSVLFTLQEQFVFLPQEAAVNVLTILCYSTRNYHVAIFT